MEPESNPCPPGHRLYGPVRWLVALNLLSVLLLAFVAFRSHGASAAPTAWEYKVEEIADTGFDDRLSLLGKQGWEIVWFSRGVNGGSDATVYETQVIFKRPAH